MQPSAAREPRCYKPPWQESRTEHDAYEALAKVATDDIDQRLGLDVAVVVGSVVLTLILGALTLRRRTA